MAMVVQVRFRPTGGLYAYDATGLPPMQPGDFVVVQTQFGPQVGEVVRIQTEAEAPQTTESILRRASARDLAVRRLRQNKEVELLVNLRAKLKALARSDKRYRTTRIVEVELSLDDRQVRILYTLAEEDAQVGSALRRLAQRLVGPRQVHWFRLRPRDAAKLTGGVGACGMPQRCCSLFMTSFHSVSVRMAKIQGIALGPSDISGMCGRLRCCLYFEYEQYAEARATLPRERSQVQTPEGIGRVLSVQPLAGQVTVEIPDKGRFVFSAEQVAPRVDAGPCAHCPHQTQTAETTSA